MDLVQGCRVVAEPTIEQLHDDQGPVWRVSYAGMVREHRQDWQAWVFFQWALALYHTGSSLP